MRRSGNRTRERARNRIRRLAAQNHRDPESVPPRFPATFVSFVVKIPIRRARTDLNCAAGFSCAVPGATRLGAAGPTHVDRSVSQTSNISPEIGH